MEYTAIGDTVNLASRVEGLTKSRGEPVLITKAAAERIRNLVPVRALEPQSVKRQPKPVEIYAVERTP